jgi:hypothetical protein
MITDTNTAIQSVPKMPVMQAAIIAKMPAVLGRTVLSTLSDGGNADDGTGIRFIAQ